MRVERAPTRTAATAPVAINRQTMRGLTPRASDASGTVNSLAVGTGLSGTVVAMKGDSKSARHGSAPHGAGERAVALAATSPRNIPTTLAQLGILKYGSIARR